MSLWDIADDATVSIEVLQKIARSSPMRIWPGGCRDNVVLTGTIYKREHALIIIIISTFLFTSHNGNFCSFVDFTSKKL